MHLTACTAAMWCDMQINDFTTVATGGNEMNCRNCVLRVASPVLNGLVSEPAGMQERCQSFANINEQEQHIMFYPWVSVSHSMRSPQKHPKDKRQWTHSVDAANAACVAQGEVVAELKA